MASLDRLLPPTGSTCTACRMPVDLVQSSNRARGLPEVFHVSARSRSIVCCGVDLRDRVVRSCQRLIGSVLSATLVQANDVTWPAVAWVCKAMKLGMHRV